MMIITAGKGKFNATNPDPQIDENMISVHTVVLGQELANPNNNMIQGEKALNEALFNEASSASDMHFDGPSM